MGKMPAHRADLQRLSLQRLAWLYVTRASTTDLGGGGLDGPGTQGYLRPDVEATALS